MLMLFYGILFTVWFSLAIWEGNRTSEKTRTSSMVKNPVTLLLATLRIPLPINGSAVTWDKERVANSGFTLVK